MIESLENTLISFIYNIRIVDILDIALVACILYFILNWVRQNVSGRSLAGFSILVIIYTTARLTGMYLTELLIEGFFVVFLIGLVIVFQSDIRRLVDRIGNWRILNQSNSSTTDNVPGVIAEAADKMASANTGALMVVKGNDRWDRQTQGGTSIDGLVTVPLLQSIFNPKGPGHDGAVLIDGDTLTKFSVYLPLSANLDKISEGGTRHAAALGLSEQCDALVVVVSEERGEISVAQNGYLHTLSDSTELKKKLDDFWDFYYTSSDSSGMHWWKRRSPRTAVGAVVLSFILWLAFVYQPGTVYRTYNIPIEYRNIKAGASLYGSLPSTISITLAGSEQAFENFNSNELVASFDLSSADAKDGVLKIGPEDMGLPADLSLYGTTPDRLLLNKNSKK